MSKNSEEKTENTINLKNCPHCGVKLSPWEQVLLNVDRTLMCKNCWYRIILDISKTDIDSNDKD